MIYLTVQGPPWYIPLTTKESPDSKDFNISGVSGLFLKFHLCPDEDIAQFNIPVYGKTAQVWGDMSQNPNISQIT